MNTVLSNGRLTAVINTLGAELNSLKDGNGREYIWEGNPAFWGKHSPVLFPIVGTLKNNSYSHRGREYGMPRHGFARDSNFVIRSQTGDSIAFSLSSNEETLNAYPFDFELVITFTLNETTLRIDYSVTNNGNETMPFSLGAHPAFALPEDFGQYSLHFEKKELLVCHLLDAEGLVAPQTITLPGKDGTLPLSYELFENDALIFKSLRSHCVTLFENTTPILEVGYKKFPHLGIWTKKDAPFICIEPWQGYSDTPEHNGNLSDKEGIVELNAGGQYEAALSVKIII